jgi:hypothetical protein
MPAITYIQTIYVMAMNTITDFYLMAIPLPMVWRARMPWRKKIIIMVMFSGAFLEMAFGILRAVSILTVGILYFLNASLGLTVPLERQH